MKNMHHAFVLSFSGKSNNESVTFIINYYYYYNE